MTRFFLLLFIAIFSNSLTAQEETGEPSGSLFGEFDGEVLTFSSAPVFSEQEIRERLQNMSGCIPMTYTDVVRAYVTTYVHKKPEKTRAMLGKRLIYFDLFVQKLKEHDMPEDLKYLAVLESALEPTAVSRSGAVGLWQFMPATGREYGLQQNSLVDERRDPVRSTDAACRYLKRLHRTYGDWALAMAAYNSGPGNVNKAIKRAHSKNFWKIKDFLPKETRNYVPAFIAASYICQYHTQHGIKPIYPSLDHQLNSHLRVFNGMTFSQICDATGLDYKVVSDLNPSYLQQFVPESSAGNFVNLPYRVITGFAAQLSKQGAKSLLADFDNQIFAAPDAENPGYYTSSSYFISNGDHIRKVAMSLSCNEEHLCAWNNLKGTYVPPGTFVQVWRPILVQAHSNVQFSSPNPSQPAGNSSPKSSAPAAKKEVKPLEIIKSPEIKTVETQLSTPAMEKIPQQKEYDWYLVRRGESLQDIAQKNETTVRNLLDLNPGVRMAPGTRVRIRAVE